MTESSQRNQIIAGIFVLLGLVFVCGLVLEFGPLQHRMRKPYTVFADFSDAQSIIAGSPVRRAGAQIGKVAGAPQLRADLQGVRVPLEIYPEFQLPKTSTLRVVSIGLMGDCAIDVTTPDVATSETLVDGDIISGVATADFSSSATRITDEALVVMKDLRGGIATLNQTLGRFNAGVLSETNLTGFSDALKNLNQALEKLNTGVLSDANTKDLSDAIAGLKSASTAISAAATTADGALTKGASAMAKMDKAMDHLGPSIKGIEGATTAFRSAANVLQELLKEVRYGPGLMHSLLSDARVRDNFVRLLANLRRSGIIFYKDKEPSRLSNP
jgi:phospholipid/cholesterol/gamma-HCH transport system substrate-binding protein